MDGFEIGFWAQKPFDTVGSDGDYETGVALLDFRDKGRRPEGYISRSGFDVLPSVFLINAGEVELRGVKVADGKVGCKLVSGFADEGATVGVLFAAGALAAEHDSRVVGATSGDVVAVIRLPAKWTIENHGASRPKKSYRAIAG